MDLGRLGICDCGLIAVVRCADCGDILCGDHAMELPPVPDGVSGYGAGQFSRAVRAVDRVRCVSCRARLGWAALDRALSAPREPLPDHWLDRAVALIGDDTRGAEEKRIDGQPPSTLTPSAVAIEFLQRIGSRPTERAPVTPPGLFRGPSYTQGWTVDGRRTEYSPAAPGAARYPLPLLISIKGGLLGPKLEESGRASATWFPVPDADIDLARLVSGVANILVLSRFSAPRVGDRRKLGDRSPRAARPPSRGAPAPKRLPRKGGPGT